MPPRILFIFASLLIASPAPAEESLWSLAPIHRPTPPAVPESSRPLVANAIDHFVFAKLHELGLKPSPLDDRRTRIIRVTLDLTGLRPTPEEIDRFLADARPDAVAYAAVVDRLLASPAYGERWARHWLDVIRFGESHGYETNQLRPNAWYYRDWLVRALNDDIPFDQFVREQLAGDRVPDGDVLTQAATGFLVAGAHDMVKDKTIEGTLQRRQDDLADMVGGGGGGGA